MISHTPAHASPVCPAARCRELARHHGVTVYDRPDGKGRHVFLPVTAGIPLKFYEACGEDWHDLPYYSRFWAPDLEIAAVLACGEFKFVSRLVELDPPGAPEQAELFAEAA